VLTSAEHLSLEDTNSTTNLVKTSSANPSQVDIRTSSRFASASLTDVRSSNRFASLTSITLEDAGTPKPAAASALASGYSTANVATPQVEPRYLARMVWFLRPHIMASFIAITCIILLIPTVSNLLAISRGILAMFFSLTLFSTDPFLIKIALQIHFSITQPEELFKPVMMCNRPNQGLAYVIIMFIEVATIGGLAIFLLRNVEEGLGIKGELGINLSIGLGMVIFTTTIMNVALFMEFSMTVFPVGFSRIINDRSLANDEPNSNALWLYRFLKSFVPL
jgi:hypothetical protein